MNEPKTKLVDLVQGYLNDALSAEEFDRLQQLLSADQSAADIFTHAVEMDSMLQELLGKEGVESETANLVLASLGISGLTSAVADREKETPSAQEELNPTASSGIEEKSPVPPISSKANGLNSDRFFLASPSFLVSSALVAACLFLAWGILSAVAPDENRPEENHLAKVLPEASDDDERVVARLTRVWKPKWIEPSQGVRDWAELKIGQVLELESGKAEIFFATGAQLILEGPFRFEVIGPNQGKVFHGKIVTRVSEEARGFSLLTSVGNVIDYGTEFGLNVGLDGVADLVVFDGEVGLEYAVASNASPGNPELRLVAGQGARIGLDGSTERIVSINSEQFPRAALDNLPTSSRQTVISDISDNIREPGVGSFYEIVHGGLNEDSLAYVDRTYEWNGVTSAGMPEFLIGADYVRTFNSDKSQGSFQAIVELAQPADLYIFWDDRLPIPKWLTQEFSDTGQKIGVDEEPNERNGMKPNAIEVGPGTGVDRSFSIWRRAVSVAGSVKLGPVVRIPRNQSNYSGSVSMYGIAAVAAPNPSNGGPPDPKNPVPKNPVPKSRGEKPREGNPS